MDLDEIRNGKPCPLCNGKGERLYTSFVDPSKEIMRPCMECKKGRICMPSKRTVQLLDLVDKLKTALRQSTDAWNSYLKNPDEIGWDLEAIVTDSEEVLSEV